MEEIKSGIYQIVNLVNNKLYIGSAVKLNRRKYHHFNKLKNNKHGNNHLQRAWNIYGKDNFKFEIIEYIEDENKLLEREQYWIDKYNTTNKKFGYNIRIIARNNYGIKYNEDQKLNISKSKGSKPFYVFKNKIIIGEWINKEKCARELNIYACRIKDCLLEKGQSHKGYVFIYKEIFSNNKLDEIYNKTSNKKFYVFKNMKKVGEYTNRSKCAKELNINSSDISSCLKEKKYSIKGYVFIYENIFSLEKLKYIYNKSRLKKPFYVFKNKTKIGEWVNQRKCAEELKINYKNINNCLKGRRLTCNDYAFIFVEEYSKEKLEELYYEIEKYKIKLSPKQFNVYKKETNEYVGTYNNQHMFAKDFKLNIGNIQACLNGKQNHTGGYIFKYVS